MLAALQFRIVCILACSLKTQNYNLYGCETWSLTLKKEYRLRVFENRVLRKIFGLKKDKGRGCCRKRYHPKLHNLYSSPNIVRIKNSRWIIWARHAARMRAV
jgi:hypothetical protein